MWPFKEGKDFDAVIEGTWHDEWRRSHYKVARLEIPEKISVVNDGEYTYGFYGITEDFQHIVKIEKRNGLEFKLAPLNFCPGRVLSGNGGSFPNVLERPRLICVMDGRIFLDNKLSNRNEDYISAIPDIIKIAGEVFKREDIRKTYRDLKVST